MLIATYLAAIVAANLLVTAFGPAWSIVNAFVLIGLDLTVRDRLHDRWQGNVWPRMLGLIAVGGAISWLVNRDAGQIAVASTVSFVLASLADAGTYALLRRKGWMARANGSNVVGAAVDSVVFPTLAFGALLPLVVLGQFVAKVAGGFVWSLLLERRKPKPAPTCPGCGRELIDWTDQSVNDGKQIERLWTGCPVWHDLQQRHDHEAWEEKRRHVAKWRYGTVTPLVEL